MANEQKPIDCSHQLSDDVRQVCPHLLENAHTAQFQYFDGDTKKYALICASCRDTVHLMPANLQSICSSCFSLIEDEGWWNGIAGQPPVGERPSSLYFDHRTILGLDFGCNELIDIQPLVGTDKSEWIGLTADNILLHFQLDEPATVTTLGAVTVPGNHSFTALQLAPDGKLAVVYQSFGQHGVVVELETLQQRKHLQRDGYHNDISHFPVAFVVHQERTLLIHSPRWNRLDICDPWTDELLTTRESPTDEKGEPRSEYYLDYFHGNLVVSLDQQWIADNGWVWGSAGAVTTWNLQRWLTINVWESEDGNTKHNLFYRDPLNEPICWIDNQTLAVWGYGDEEWLIPAVRLFDVVSGLEKEWFAGPEVAFKNGTKQAGLRDALLFDEYLFSVSAQKGVQVWDVETGERLLTDTSFFPRRYSKGTREFFTLLPSGAIQLSWLVDDLPT